jgi:hypothetical protein
MASAPAAPFFRGPAPAPPPSATKNPNTQSALWVQVSRNADFATSYGFIDFSIVAAQELSLVDGVNPQRARRVTRAYAFLKSLSWQ